MTEPADLYGLPLDRFVSERGTLAKALRTQGRREEAAHVAGLRKPSVAAWTVNQLLRTQSRAVTSLFDAGDELQDTQANVLAGKGQAGALRAAAERERAAVAKLVGTARGLLSSEGQEPTPATLERVSETLHAAALDPGARAQVKDGCLERELRWVGFGGPGGGGGGGAASGARGAGASAARGAGRGPARAQSAGRASTAGKSERERAQRERAERERHRAGELKAARKAEADARRLAERAARDMRSAQEHRDRAAELLSDAEEVLAAATDRAEQAALEHRRAQEALERV